MDGCSWSRCHMTCSNPSVSSQHCLFCSRWSENLSLFSTLVLCEHALDSLAAVCPSAHTACAVNFPPCSYELEPCARLDLCMRSPRPTQVLIKAYCTTQYATLLRNHLSFKGPARWLCSRQHLRKILPWPFSLFLWKILL